jgi:hypothetical protein
VSSLKANGSILEENRLPDYVCSGGFNGLCFDLFSDSDWLGKVYGF